MVQKPMTVAERLERVFVQNAHGKWEHNRDPILDDPFDELELSVRVWHRLPSLGVKTIRDLTSFSRLDLLRVWGLGRKSVAEIEEELARYGWTLRNTCDHCGDDRDPGGGQAPCGC